MDKTKIIEEVQKKPTITLDYHEVEWFVDTAIRKCLNLKYPFKLDADVADIDRPFFHRWLIDASIAMIENQGIANIKAYSEIGLSIRYNDMVDGIPKSLINQILPEVGNLQ